MVSSGQKIWKLYAAIEAWYSHFSVFTNMTEIARRHYDFVLVIGLGHQLSSVLNSSIILPEMP